MTRIRTFRATRWAMLILVAALLGLWVPGTTANAVSVSILVSANANRSSAVPLAGTTRSGNLYIFTSPTSGVAKVTFWLDDPQRTGLAKQVESWAPFDFRGGDTTANPWDSRFVANGTHTITVAVVSTTAVTTVVTASFTVSNGTVAGYAPQASTSSNRSAPFPLSGAVLSGKAYIFVPSVVGITKVSFYLDDKARAHPPMHVESTAPWDFASTSSVALPWSTTSVSNGQHTLSVDVLAGTTVTKIDTPFTVLNAVAPTPTPTPTTAAPTTTPAGPTPSDSPPPASATPTDSPPPASATPTISPSPAPPAPFVTHYTYTPIATLPIGTTEANSTVVNGKLYLFGGFNVQVPRLDPTTRSWLYDPATNVWSSLPPMPVGGISHAGIDSDGSRYIYYAGGFALDPTGQARLQGTTLVWRYDTVTGLYSSMPPLPDRRAAGGLSYINGTLYYFGGEIDYPGPNEGTTWSLDVANNATTWVALATMPNPRNHVGWATVNGQIYVAGGQYGENSNTAQSELDRYDPATNTWTTLAPMPFARSHMLDSTFVLSGHVVVATGWTTTAKTAAVTAYDPATNTWQAMTDVPSARTSATMRAISGGRVVLCCGSAGGSTSNGWIGVPAP